MMKLIGRFALLFASLAGCKPTPTEAGMEDALKRFRAQQRQMLEKQAIFDLNCAVEELAWVRLADQLWGVRGCGKQVRYVEICQQRINERLRLYDRCRWVRDSAVEPVDIAGDERLRRMPGDRL